jgi:hypothetical protein
VTAIVRLTMLDGWLHVGDMHAAIAVRVHDRDHGAEWTIGVGSALVELELDGAVATPRSIPAGVELVLDDYDTGVFGEAFRCGDNGLPRLVRPGVWDQLREAA